MKKTAIAAVALLVLAPNLFAAEEAEVTTAPLTRTADPLVLKGDAAGDFAGAKVEKIGLLKYQDGDFSPIPFQVDEVHQENGWVLPLGAEANPDDGDGDFSGSDELVFMARDAGVRAPAESVIDGATKISEITLTDPNGGVGYVYLALFSGAPPKSDLDYVGYDPKEKKITADYYEMGFHPKFPIGIGHLAARPAGGGDGKNIIDRMKVRVEASAILGLDFSRNEEDFSSVDVAYIDGPVRVIRRTRNRMVLIWKIPTPSAIIDNIYYREFFYFPTEVNVPFNISSFIKEAHVRVSVDHSEAGRGNVFFNSRNKRNGLVFDGKMNKAEMSLDKRPFEWMVNIANRPGVHYGWLNRITVEAKVGTFRPDLYYADDSSIMDQPEETPGHFGDVGFIINDLPSLDAGIYRMVSTLYCIPKYVPGAEKPYLDILDVPLRLEISPRGAHKIDSPE